MYAGELFEDFPEPDEVGRRQIAQRGWRAGDDVLSFAYGTAPALGQFHRLAPAIAGIGRARQQPEGVQLVHDDRGVRRVRADGLRQLGEAQRPASQAQERLDPAGAAAETERLPELIGRVVAADETGHEFPGRAGEAGLGSLIARRPVPRARFDRWSPALRCSGISVGYRLAPETPFPGPLEDCYAALAWAYRNAPDLGIGPGRIGIIGGIAGGGLAAGLALLVRDRAEIPVAFQVLSYPMLDDRQTTRSGRAGAPLWEPAANQFGWRSYLSGLAPRDDIPGYAAPARAADLAGLPATFITVGNLDGLLDEDIDYARRLVAAGVPTDLHVFADAPHAFDSMLADTAVAHRAARVLEDWLESRMHP